MLLIHEQVLATLTIECEMLYVLTPQMPEASGVVRKLMRSVVQNCRLPQNHQLVWRQIDQGALESKDGAKQTRIRWRRDGTFSLWFPFGDWTFAEVEDLRDAYRRFRDGWSWTSPRFGPEYVRLRVQFFADPANRDKSMTEFRGLPEVAAIVAASGDRVEPSYAYIRIE